MPEVPVPRYFFDLADNNREIDDDGIELPGHAEARREAVIFLGATIRDEPEKIWDGRELRVEVRDEERRLVLTVIALAVDMSREEAGPLA